MSGATIAFTAIGFLVVLLAMRFPIGPAMIVTSFAGIWAMLGPMPAIGLMKSVPMEFAANWTLSSIPMFLLMGYIGYYAGQTTSMFSLFKAIFARVPGSLAISGIVACAGFSAVSGSSVATAAAIGRITIPEMIRAGYDRNFACGTIAAGGTLGALIPPSIALIIYGVLAETSIVDLLLGSIGVGVATAIGYVAVIMITAWLRPDLVPRTLPDVPREVLIASLKEMGPIILLIIGTFGGLFAGIFTTTEAGAIGAGLACVIAIAQRRLSWATFLKSITETVATCGSLFIIGVGATLFMRLLSLSGAGSFITAFVSDMDLNYWQLMLMLVALYLVLGTALDGIGAMLITLPIVLPILDSHQISLVFFGVFLCKMNEIGQITPPLGLTVFIVKSIVGNLTTVTGVFKGVLYFLAADMVVVALIIVFPDIIMYLPRVMG